MLINKDYGASITISQSEARTTHKKSAVLVTTGMGCASSSNCQLEVSSPSPTATLQSFRGAFVVTVPKRTRLERSVRVSMALRARIATPENPVETRLKHSSGVALKDVNVWKVEAEIAKKGSYLEQGVNRLVFDLPLGKKMASVQDYIGNRDEYIAMYQPVLSVKYEYVIRAGSLQLKEFVQYPNELLPNGMPIVLGKNNGP